VGGISRHPGPADKPVCVLCGEGEAVHTPAEWLAVTARLAEARTSQTCARRGDMAGGWGEHCVRAGGEA